MSNFKITDQNVPLSNNVQITSSNLNIADNAKQLPSTHKKLGRSGMRRLKTETNPHVIKLIAQFEAEKSAKFIEGRLVQVQNIDAIEPNGKTALILAIERGDLEEVKRLVALGANINLITPFKQCAIVCALKSPLILEFLVSAGADVNIKLSERKTPLHFLMEYNSPVESLNILLKNGANINAIDLYGRTPLHRPANNKITFILLEHGANINIADDEGWTPLHRAYQQGDIDLLKAFIKRGGSLNEFTPAGFNALHHALHWTARPNCLSLLKWLIEDQKMDVNQEGKAGIHTGLSPISCAICSQKQLEDDFTILDYLLEQGAEINTPVFRYIPNPQKQYVYKSTLAWARGTQQPRYIIEWLIENGATE